MNSRSIQTNNNQVISILGAGSWGGTLAWLLSQKNYNVNLWTFSKDEFEKLSKTRTLLRPKKINIGKKINITMDLNFIAKYSDVIIFAVPSNAFEAVVKKLKNITLKKTCILVSATKGITNLNCKRPSQILKKYFSSHNYAVLSGPNIELDVISKNPVISISFSITL